MFTLVQCLFQVLLILAYKLLADDSNYFILMANGGGVQDQSTRMNHLLHTLDVTSGTCSTTNQYMFELDGTSDGDSGGQCKDYSYFPTQNCYL